MSKKERSDILCPFCERQLYFKRITIDSEFESAIVKTYWCTCRSYRRAVRLTDRYLKFRDDAYKKRDRMSREFKSIVKHSPCHGYVSPYKNYATFNFLGIMDDQDIALDLYKERIKK